MEEKKIQAIKKKHEKKLLGFPNVVGVGIGEKVRGGIRTGRTSVKIYVEKKIPKIELAKKDLVPETISLAEESVETDVEEVGKITALSYKGRYRPAPPGCSVGHYKITAGTFGCLVKERKSDQVFILSNNHVLANSNKAKRGDAILQPGPHDGGKNPQDRIASLEKWEEIKFDGQTNLIDAALAKPEKVNLVKSEIILIGKIKGQEKARVGMKVQKTGRTTGYTIGVIRDINATIKVDYDGQVALFQNQIMTSAMSSGGDSGSLVLERKNKVIGLLFAGSEVVTLLNPIITVLETFKISLI